MQLVFFGRIDLAECHMNGQGCKKCALERNPANQKITTKEFVKRLKEVHGDKYDYSLVVWKDKNSKIKLICPEHGIFKRRADQIRQGKGCPKCARKIKNQKQTKDTAKFVGEAKKIHGDRYDYSKAEYVRSDKKLIIICSKHGDFNQKPSDHLFGYGCEKCAVEETGKLIRKSVDEFIRQAKEVHGDHYDYSKVEYVNSTTKVKIICPKHGIFKQTPDTHIKDRGCPVCSESKGEKRIRKFLKTQEFKFKAQHAWEDCRLERLLYFDFYLPEINSVIEYHGKQHYEPVEIFGGEERFKLQQLRDKIKKDYCISKGIGYIEISYEVEDIEDFLINEFNNIINHY